MILKGTWGRVVLCVLISISLLIFHGNHAIAQISWITGYSIRDLTDNRDLQAGEPLVAGHTYKLSVTLLIPATQPGGVFIISLTDRMGRSGPIIWELVSQGYQGFDQNLFTPGQYNISFRQVQGSLAVAATFVVPQNYTVAYSSGGVVIRQPRDEQVITAAIPGGSVVGVVRLRVVDGIIQTYENLYKEKSNLISSGAIDRSYESFVKELLAQASNLASLGLYDQAISLLRSISPSNLPQPPSGNIVLALIGGIIALGAMAAFLFIMMARARSARDEALDKIREARNRVAGMKVRAQRFDKALAQELESLEKILGEEV